MTAAVAILAALTATAAIVTACGPPPPPPAVQPQVAYACDPNHTPNNDRSWCMVWIDRTHGWKVNPGPVWIYQFDASRPAGATLLISAKDWRSAP